jgi:hypothetical protein
MEEEASKTSVRCTERQSLARKLDEARSDYNRAAETLRGRAGVLEKAEYQRLNRAVEEAWSNVKDARAALDEHIDQHGC